VEYLVGAPYIDEITVGGWSLDGDGMLAIPDRPGLGVTVDLDAVSRYADDPAVVAAVRGAN
jgi:D-galactarolactone cycloisomerase